MTLPSLLRHNPGRRISAFDGMTVTAEVWQEAHEYHRYQQRVHALNGHGVGILAGLEIIASEPASQTVYILPGAAIDPSGNLILVDQPAAYDLGKYRDGVLHLLLTYDESRPQPQNGQYADNPFFVHTGYNVETVVDRTDTPQVELARIPRQGRETPITNAADFYRPGFNEIDLRFRPEVAALARATLLVGIAYLSRLDDPSHGRGFYHLARSVSMQPEMRVLVNEGIDLSGDLGEYTLICLVAKENFDLEVAEVNNLYDFVRKGGTLFVESCHREGGANPRANDSFAVLISALGSRPQVVKRHAPLLSEPFFFARPPDGYESQGAPELRVDGGVVLSTCDYGCLWQGERRSGAASREEIRAGMEWGHNLLLYAWQRRQRGRSA
ncbi:MAG: DUF4159 domain-containing protein [Chloroflexi bacterium]|nr:DUF4159 domain-containing protein [Chloroflexota bacterium]